MSQEFTVHGLWYTSNCLSFFFFDHHSVDQVCLPNQEGETEGQRYREPWGRSLPWGEVVKVAWIWTLLPRVSEILGWEVPSFYFTDVTL